MEELQKQTSRWCEAPEWHMSAPESSQKAPEVGVEQTAHGGGGGSCDFLTCVRDWASGTDL